MNEAVDSTINQISSSSFEWWSSFVWSLSSARARVFRHRAVSWACGSLQQSQVEYCFGLVGSLCVGA